MPPGAGQVMDSSKVGPGQNNGGVVEAEGESEHEGPT